MNRPRWTLALCLLGWLMPCPSSAVEIETVLIGNPGADGPNNVGAPRPGIVDTSFRIGKYEVTNEQYVEFLNAVDPSGSNSLGLYNSVMASSTSGGIFVTSRGNPGERYRTIAGRENYPVVMVSWYDAARFTNWLHNGQGGGDTETGAYELASHPLDREPDAIWFLPTRAEWVKAAYHSNDANSFYFAFPTGTDSIPIASSPSGAPNRANYDNAVGGVVPVGSYPNSASQYGTFDQGGNVREWTGGLTPSGLAGIQGGSWFNGEGSMALNSQGFNFATFEATSFGFRVATLVPEPTTSTLTLGCLYLICRRRRSP